MRTKIFLAIACLILAIPGFGATTNTVNVQVTYADFQLTYQQVRRTTLMPLVPFADYGGTTLLTPAPRSQVTSSSGSTTFSNVVSGYAYRLTLDTPFGATVRTCGFPAQLTGTVSAVTYLGDIHAMVFYYLYHTNEVLSASQTNILVANVINSGTMAYSNAAGASGFQAWVTNAILANAGGGGGGGKEVVQGSGPVTVSTNAIHTAVTISSTALYDGYVGNAFIDGNLQASGLSLDPGGIVAEGNIISSGGYLAAAKVIGGDGSGDPAYGLFGVAAGISNVSPYIATNALASDSFVLIKTGSNVKWVNATNVIANLNASNSLATASMNSNTIAPQTLGTNLLSQSAYETLTRAAPPGYVWPAVPYAPFVIDEWGTFTSDWGQTNVGTYGTNSVAWWTNNILWCKTNLLEYFPNLIFEINDGWQDYARDGNGDLTWNSIFAPVGGMPYMAAFAHSNGIMARIYTALNDTTCMGRPGSQLTNVYRDVQTFMRWGFDGILVDACDTSGIYSTNKSYQRAYARQVNQAIMDYHALVANTNGYVRPFAVQLVPHLDFNTPRDYSPEDHIFGANSFSVAGDLSTGNMDFTNSILSLKSIGNKAYWVGPGHAMNAGQFVYQNGSFYDNSQRTNLFNVFIMGPQMMLSGWGAYAPAPYTPDAGGGSYALMPFLTNKLAMRIWHDALQIGGKLAWSNNLAEVWQRPLGAPYGVINGGSNCVLLVNENTTASQNITLNALDFGGYSNTTYRAVAVWSGVATFFTNAAVFTVTKTNTELYVVTPVAESLTNSMNSTLWDFGKSGDTTANLRLSKGAAGLASLSIDGLSVPFDIWYNASGGSRYINAPGGFAVGFNVTGGDTRLYIQSSGGFTIGLNSLYPADPGANNLLVVSNIISANGRFLATNGVVFPSNNYPITTAKGGWPALGNCGCITWMSNATLYLICTNSINGNATTNKLGGL